MSGHRPWSEVRRRGTPEEETEIAEEVRALLRENALAQLRRRHEISQQDLAAALGVSQVNVSRIERANEPQLSTMRRFIEALGGELIVQARIDGEIIDLLAHTPE
jgi:transcriptional regulator with XRE-family HTH domain